mmetsp:Transcript_141597/g.452766  ORF Transcript_141597/g.452766 Transcript_141597/m.452766 type:complete len:671 (-) Transcript_141597:47-2059(-)
MLAEKAVDIHALRLALRPLVEVEDTVQHRGDDHGANLDDHVVKALDRAGDDVHNLGRRLHHVQSVADAPVAPLRKLIGEARQVPHERDLLRSESRRSHVLVRFVEELLLLAVAQELQHRLRRLRRCLVHGRVGGLKSCLEALHCHLGLEAGLLGLVQARVLQGEVHDETQGRAHHAMPELAAAILLLGGDHFGVAHEQAEDARHNHTRWRLELPQLAVDLRQRHQVLTHHLLGLLFNAACIVLDHRRQKGHGDQLSLEEAQRHGRRLFEGLPDLAEVLLGDAGGELVLRGVDVRPILLREVVIPHVLQGLLLRAHQFSGTGLVLCLASAGRAVTLGAALVRAAHAEGVEPVADVATLVGATYPGWASSLRLDVGATMLTLDLQSCAIRGIAMNEALGHNPVAQRALRQVGVLDALAVHRTHLGRVEDVPEAVLRALHDLRDVRGSIDALAETVLTGVCPSTGVQHREELPGVVAGRAGDLVEHAGDTALAPVPTPEVGHAHAVVLAVARGLAALPALRFVRSGPTFLAKAGLPGVAPQLRVLGCRRPTLVLLRGLLPDEPDGALVLVLAAAPDPAVAAHADRAGACVRLELEHRARGVPLAVLAASRLGLRTVDLFSDLGNDRSSEPLFAQLLRVLWLPRGSRRHDGRGGTEAQRQKHFGRCRHGSSQQP